MGKKMLLMVLLLFVCSAIVVSGNSMTQAQMILRSSNYLDDSSLLRLSQLSADLSDTEKMMLINSYEKSPWGPFALNFFLGFGIGSFVQGNTTAGLIQLAGDSVGILLYISVVSDAFSTSPDTFYDDFDSAMTKTAIAGLVLVASRIYGLVTPFTTAKSYNDKLSSAIYGGMNFTLLPTYNDGLGVELAASIPLFK